MERIDREGERERDNCNRFFLEINEGKSSL